ncbi:MAG: hypothetical protein WCF90_02465 [Methanomicrobiales archaeon]
MMEAPCNSHSPLKNMQVKLGNINQMEMSEDTNLQKYGCPVNGPVYLKGTLGKPGSGSVNIIVKVGSLGLITVPDGILQQVGDNINEQIHHQMGSMPGVKINTQEIQDGQLHYRGAFAHTAAV